MSRFAQRITSQIPQGGFQRFKWYGLAVLALVLAYAWGYAYSEFRYDGYGISASMLLSLLSTYFAGAILLLLLGIGVFFL